MENENLTYWKFQVETNKMLINVQKEMIKVGEKALNLKDSFLDKDIKILMGPE